MDSAQAIANKLGLGDEYRKMKLSGVSELQRLDYITAAYVEFLKESRIQMLASLIESKVANGEYDRNLLISQIADILTDANFFHDS